MKTITELEFQEALTETLKHPYSHQVNSVTGAGRSGAICAVYVSHCLRIPFFPYGTEIPDNLRPTLAMDTASNTGRTLRKAMKKYNTKYSLAVFNEVECGRVKFWYEK